MTVETGNIYRGILVEEENREGSVIGVIAHGDRNVLPGDEHAYYVVHGGITERRANGTPGRIQVTIEEHVRVTTLGDEELAIVCPSRPAVPDHAEAGILLDDNGNFYRGSEGERYIQFRWRDRDALPNTSGSTHTLLVRAQIALPGEE